MGNGEVVSGNGNHHNTVTKASRFFMFRYINLEVISVNKMETIIIGLFLQR